MGWGRVEWYWHMGMSYLTSLNPQLSKNIAYVGSFEHFSVQLFLHVFCNSTKTSANSSDRNPENSKHIREGQCTKIYWHIKLYTTEHPPLGSSPEMVYDKHKRQYWNYWSPEVRANKIKLRKICPNKKLHNTAYFHFFLIILEMVSNKQIFGWK